MKLFFPGKFNSLSWKSSGSFDQSFFIPEKVIAVDNPFHISLVFLPTYQPPARKADKEPMGANC